MKPLDLTKPIQTRDGRPAKFLHKLDQPGLRYGTVAVINFQLTGKEHLNYFDCNGFNNSIGPSPDDLINVPVKHVREYWVACTKHGCFLYVSLEMARVHTDCIACKKITIEFEEGEGL